VATITGFTAERMLVIENETVVDGEVQGDNLHLIRRDGIIIDAGNVRGPKGDPGATGIPGVIDSVNDVSAPFVYSPRQFVSRVAIDSEWPNAPIGSVAVVYDGSNTIWQKDSVGWFIVNGVRIFSDTAERDSRWANPPDGSVCHAPAGIEYRRIGGVWKSPAPRGIVVASRGPATAVVVSTNGATLVYQFSFPTVAGRKYKIDYTVGYFGSGTANGTNNQVRARLDGGDAQMQPYHLNTINIWARSNAFRMLDGDGATHTAGIAGASGSPAGAALNFAANNIDITVEDIGPT
jgi:hypothetical protein